MWVEVISMALKKLSMVVFPVLLCATALMAQTGNTCSVGIDSPQQGDSVSVSGDISGTAKVPPGMFLWVFAHRKGLNAWWPQSGGAAEVVQGKWTVNATYGDDKDRGANFVVKAVVVDQKGNTDLQNYVKRTETNGTYPGTQIPGPSGGSCSSTEIIIKRQS
jgi:hypothetical protein